jgi:putative iron-dependent peroxidase
MRGRRQIIRFNMPFGGVGTAEFSTYLIGYACSVEVIEQMVRNVIVGKPLGYYDRNLVFSMSLTGATSSSSPSSSSSMTPLPALSQGRRSPRARLSE